MIKSLVGALAIVASLSACTTVSHVPLSKETSAQLKGKSVTTTQYPTADFAAFTPTKAVFGVLGALAMIADGNKIVKTNNIEDPALKISQELAVKLNAVSGMTVVANGNTTSKSDDVSALLSSYPKTDYLVDVKTFAWQYVYYPTDWSHYKVMYNARFRLIESSTKKVIAETLCRYVQKDDENRPTQDQLLENQAQLLKDQLGKAVSACVEVLSKDILGMTQSASASGATVVKDGSSSKEESKVGKSANPGASKPVVSKAPLPSAGLAVPAAAPVAAPVAVVTPVVAPAAAPVVAVPAAVPAPAARPVAAPLPVVALANATPAKPDTSATNPVNDADKLPLSKEGRDEYRQWLTKPLPRAFAVAANGVWLAAWGTKPQNTALPTNPSERALQACQNRAKEACKLYAVDNEVVWGVK
jgi:hypothetical protein